MSEQLFRSSDTRKLVTYAESLGYVTSPTQRGHIACKHPNGSLVLLASKPRRGPDYQRQLLRRKAAVRG